jgi:glyceraldehyde 3-phosphate dehydrogenase
MFECTGVFREREALEKHLHAGANHVVLSAPANDEVLTVVYGVNAPEKATSHILSCASCATNSITPVVEVTGRRIGVEKATLTTVHAYTSSQQIVDSPAKNWRPGRAGAANFVPTTTGAAVATSKALPQHEGIFDGVAIRGPLPVGSIADIVFVTEKDTSVEEVDQTLDRSNDMVKPTCSASRVGSIVPPLEQRASKKDVITLSCLSSRSPVIAPYS